MPWSLPRLFPCYKSGLACSFWGVRTAQTAHLHTQHQLVILLCDYQHNQDTIALINLPFNYLCLYMYTCTCATKIQSKVLAYIAHARPHLSSLHTKLQALDLINSWNRSSMQSSCTILHQFSAYKPTAKLCKLATDLLMNFCTRFLLHTYISSLYQFSAHKLTVTLCEHSDLTYWSRNLETYISSLYQVFAHKPTVILCKHSDLAYGSAQENENYTVRRHNGSL